MVSIQFRGKEYGDDIVRTFRSLIAIAGKGLYETNPSLLEEFASNKTGRGKKAKKPTFSNDASDLRRPLEIADNVYIEGNVSSGDACRIVEFMLNECGVKIEDFCFSVARN